MDKQKIIDKIHKCLRLSESGNPNEAAMALRQAQALMRKYNIREEEVNQKINEASVDGAGYYNPPYWAVALSELIAQAFECRAYISRQTESERPSFRFIGVNYAAAVAAYTFTVLFRQLRLARRQYMAELSSQDAQERLRLGNVFAQAWLFRIAKTVAEFVTDSVAQAKVDAYVKDKYGAISDFNRAPTDPASEDYDVILSGLRAANTVELFRPVDAASQIKGLFGQCA